MRSRLDQDGIWESDWTARCSSLVPSTSRLPFSCLLFPHYLGRKNESLNQTPNNKKLHPNSIRHDRILQIKILLKVLLCSAVYSFYFFSVFYLIFFYHCFPFRLQKGSFVFVYLKFHLAEKITANFEPFVYYLFFDLTVSFLVSVILGW